MDPIFSTSSLLNSNDSLSVQTDFKEESSEIIKKVGRFNLRQYFFLSPDANITTAKEHYDMIFKPAIFDVQGLSRYQFYQTIGYWDHMEKYRDSIKENLVDNKKFQEELDEKIKISFRINYGEYIQAPGELS